MSANNGQAQILQPEEIQQLRNEVLWPHKTFENCILETDRLSTTFHFGIQEDGLTVATVTLQQEKTVTLQQENNTDFALWQCVKDTEGKGLVRLLLNRD